MKFLHLSRAIAALSLITAAVAAPASPTDLAPVLVGDAYSYWVVADGGTRERVPVFSFEQAPPPAPQFFFNYHDAQMVLQWTVDLPLELVGSTLNVTAAEVVVWNVSGAQWDPAGAELRLFAAGFGTPTEADWTEDTAYQGPGAFSPGTRFPYPADLTGARAEDNPAATPWAVGSPDPAYTGDPLVDADDAFAITFTLDVIDPAVQAKLRSDVAAGRSSWIIGSTYAAAQPPAVAYYPELVTKEGFASNPAQGASRQAPALLITVEPEVSSVEHWLLY